jgi:hypothetical protein
VELCISPWAQNKATEDVTVVELQFEVFSQIFFLSAEDNGKSNIIPHYELQNTNHVTVTWSRYYKYPRAALLNLY